MKRLTAYFTFTLVRILVLFAGIIHGDSHSEMIRVGHLCYKWYASALSISDAYDACRKEGGDLTGFENRNFLEIIQKNPMLEEYLPKENCYWANLLSGRSRLSWFEPALSEVLIEGMGMILDAFTHSKVCYDKTMWVVEIVYTERRVNFVCEHEVSLFEADGRRHDIREVKSKMVRKVEDSGFVIGQLVLEGEARVLMMCSRLCEQHTCCSMFNYNKVTKHCQGFGEMNKIDIQNHKDWEVWVFE